MKTLIYYLLLLCTISVFSNKALAQADCATAREIKSIPLINFFDDNCGMPDNYNSANVSCLNQAFFGGSDFLYKYTPTQDLTIKIQIQFNTATMPPSGGVAVFNTCPDDPGAQCMQTALYVSPESGNDNDNYPVVIDDLQLTAGNTYYILVSGGECSGDDFEWPILGCFDDNDDAEPLCPCREVDRDRDYPCTNGDDAYRCDCEIECNNVGEKFCSEFHTSISPCPMPIPSLPPDVPRVECGSNLGFEDGCMTGWTGYTGGDNVMTQMFNDENDRGMDPQGRVVAEVEGFKHGECHTNGELGDWYDGAAPPDQAYPGLNQTTRHSIMNNTAYGGTGIDPNSNGMVPVVPPNGTNNSVRIGNMEPGWRSECMETSFLVTKDNALFTYQYAVVLEDPTNISHGFLDSPRFLVELTDEQTGEEVGCGGDFNVVSLDARCQGFIRSTSSGRQGDIWFKPWTTVATDLSEYIGQRIKLRFCTADCGKGGHFAYAYVDTYCQPVNFNGAVICGTGGSVTLQAPAGFTAYNWFGPNVDPASVEAGNETPIGEGITYTIQNPKDGDTYSVSFESINGSGCVTVVTDTVRVITLEADGDTSYCDNEVPDQIELYSSYTGPEGTTFEWSANPGPFNGDPNIAAPVISPAPSVTTTYSVSVFHEEGCELTEQFVVEVPPCGMSVEVNCDEYCIGGCTTVEAVPSEGDPPLTYYWSGNIPDPGNVSSFEICPTESVTYTVTVVDADGDSATASCGIDVWPMPELTANSTNTLCGECIGTASASATGSEPLSYQWDYQNSTAQDLTGLCAGVYKVTVTDVNGCVDSGQVIVNNSGTPEISAANDTLGCYNDCSGSSAVIIEVEGKPPYTYRWNNGQTDSVATGLCAGNYTVTVWDTDSCPKLTSIQVVQPPDISVSITKQDILCYEDSTGSVNFNVTGGTEPYFYIWTNGATTQDLTGLGVGDYSVTVTDANGCIKSASESISQPPPVGSSTTPGITCEGLCFGEVSATGEGGTPEYTYSWHTGETTAMLNDLCVGDYYVTVTDANGCISLDTAEVTNFPPPENNSWRFLDCPGAPLQLPSTDGGISYRWSPATDLSSTTVPHPITKIEQDIDYTVTITHETGCISVDTVRIRVEYDPSFTLHIPNSFTPNGDGFDDFFEYTGDFSGIVEFECQIWNRWGEKIYHTFELTDYWNGRYNNKGDFVKDGAYVYIIRAKDDCVIKHKRDGTHIGWVMVLKGDS